MARNSQKNITERHNCSGCIALELLEILALGQLEVAYLLNDQSSRSPARLLLLLL